MSVREEAVQKITQRCCELFGKKPEELSENTRFIEDLGARSGNVSQMTNFLEDEFDVEVEQTEAANIRTVQEAVDYLEKLAAEN